VTELVAVLVFAAVVAIVAAVGIRLGMLLAPRLDRLTGSNEEDEGGDDD
jgi:hypothetical protein